MLIMQVTGNVSLTVMTQCATCCWGQSSHFPIRRPGNAFKEPSSSAPDQTTAAPKAEHTRTWHSTPIDMLSKWQTGANRNWHTMRQLRTHLPERTQKDANAWSFARSWTTRSQQTPSPLTRPSLSTGQTHMAFGMPKDGAFCVPGRTTVKTGSR